MNHVTREYRATHRSGGGYSIDLYRLGVRCEQIASVPYMYDGTRTRLYADRIVAGLNASEPAGGSR